MDQLTEVAAQRSENGFSPLTFRPKADPPPEDAAEERGPSEGGLEDSRLTEGATALACRSKGTSAAGWEEVLNSST